MGRVEHITSYGDDELGDGVANQVKYSYNGYRLVSETKQEHDGAVDGSTLSVKYTYDDGAASGEAKYVRLTEVEYPDGRDVYYIYPSSGIGDALSRVEAIAGDAAGATRFAEYAYLGAGTIVSVAHPAVSGGLTLDYNPSGDADGNPNDNYSGWDRFGRVVDQRWTDAAGTADLDRYSYTYDGNSNRTSRTNLVETNGVLDEDYTYDGLNRLVDTNRNGTDLQSWNLDSLGNWSSFTDEGTTEERAFNEANELLTSDTRVNPLYDAAGNMISGPRPDDPLVRQHYIYDAWNRLVEVRADNPDNPDNSGSPGDAIATFEYDGRNFRIGKTVGGVLEAFYYNEGSQVLEVRKDGDVVPSEQYVWDLRYIDAPILRATPGEVLYYANDANMNVTALVDAATGLVVERYHYDPYGEVLFMEADWTPRAASAFDNAVLYTGRRLDAETGLFYYRARYYDVALGRFINRDPIGYDGSPWNLYEYVGSRPTILLDPLGLEWVVDGQKKSRAEVTGDCGDTVISLAKELSMSAKDYQSWLVSIDGKGLPQNANSPLTQKRVFSVPNTGYIDVSTYTWGFLGWQLIGYKNGLYEKWDSEGLKVVKTYWSTNVDGIVAHLRSKDIYKFAYIGHGDKGGTLVDISNPNGDDDWILPAQLHSVWNCGNAYYLML